MNILGRVKDFELSQKVIVFILIPLLNHALIIKKMTKRILKLVKTKHIQTVTKMSKTTQETYNKLKTTTKKLKKKEKNRTTLTKHPKHLIKTTKGWWRFLNCTSVFITITMAVCISRN